MKKRIIFRADGNSTTGLGHLYRLFSFVEIVKNNYEFIFVTKQTSVQSVIPSDYNKRIILEELSLDEESIWLSKHFTSENHIIIADGYQFNSSYQKSIKKAGFTLIYIDDLATEHMFADVVINHSPYITNEDFQKESYTKLALGTQYALLRPSFIEEAKHTRIIKNIDSAFVCFGGADPFNLTFKATSALLKIDSFKKILIVVGAAYQFQDIFELKQRYPSRIDIFNNLSEKGLLQAMKNCNFAIVPASTILYEVCCVKMPVLSGFYVENQENIYKGFLDKGAIYGAGDVSKFTSADFYKRIIKVVDKNDFETYIKEQMKLFDNDTPKKYLNLIKELC